MPHKTLVQCTGAILGLHPIKERRHYEKSKAVSHWLGTNLESALNVCVLQKQTRHVCNCQPVLDDFIFHGSKNHEHTSSRDGIELKAILTNKVKKKGKILGKRYIPSK